MGNTSCYELIITLVCHRYCHYKAKGNYTVRILSKFKYKLIPERFMEPIGLENLELFKLSISIYCGVLQELSLETDQEKLAKEYNSIFGSLPFIS